jgi:hypothetical protein
MVCEIMRSFLVLLCGALLGGMLAQEPNRPAPALTLQDVLQLVREGAAEDLVIARIKRNNKPFDLNSDEVAELTRSGISSTVIRYLMDPALPYTPPAPPPPPPPEPKPAKPPKDPLVLKLPPEPGLYWLSSATPGNESFQALELKSLVPLSRGGVGSRLTAGLIKAHKIASLAGGRAPLRTAHAPNAFYARFGSKPPIDDVILLRLDSEAGRRTLDFGAKPEKPAFPPAAVQQFESKEVAEGVYRLAVPPLEPGEYVFLILGAGDEKKGVLGKGYDVGVDRERE